jgi:hypothetical protein
LKVGSSKVSGMMVRVLHRIQQMRMGTMMRIRVMTTTRVAMIEVMMGSFKGEAGSGLLGSSGKIGRMQSGGGRGWNGDEFMLVVILQEQHGAVYVTRKPLHVDKVVTMNGAMEVLLIDVLSRRFKFRANSLVV